MAHDSHFLSRLSRVTAVQADMALALYRDPKRVKYILTHVSLPEGYDRVAIALDDNHDSPHVIVDRNGVFITCLAAGMKFENCPRISRPQLDRLGIKWEVLSTASERISSENDLLALRNRLTQAGPLISREDMALLSAFQPVVRDDRWSAEINDRLLEFRSRYRSHKYRGRTRINQAQRTKLRSYWQLTWGLAHMAVLAGEHIDLTLSDMKQARHLFADDLDGMGPERFIAWPAMRTLSLPAVVRGAWQVARGGSQLVGEFKRYFDDVGSWTTFIDCSLGLLAIGLRHSRLRHEVSRVLARRNSPFFRDPHTAKFCDVFLSIFCNILTDAKLRDAMRAAHRMTGASFIVRMTSGLPEGHPYRYDDPESVPDDLAYPLMLCLDGPILQLHRDLKEHEPPNLYVAIMILVWTAKADLEELYLPADFWASNKLTWTPEVSLDLLDGQTPYSDQGNRPVRAAEKVGRNEPCPCGSGKKYKRCCSATEVEQDPTSDNPARTAEDYAPILAALLKPQTPE
jgi:hypothetical protein